MPVHALNIFIENATKMLWIILLNTKNEDQTLRQLQHFAFFDTMQSGVCQIMGIMHSDVMDTVFHCDDAWDSMP